MKIFLVLSLFFLAASARADVIGKHENARSLILSDDGKVAFSIGEASTRIWDVTGKRELESLPKIAGELIAVSKNGERVLCRLLGRKAEKEVFEFAFWQRSQGTWRKGSQVRATATHALLDAAFVDEKVVLLWEQSLEWHGENGQFLKTKRLPFLKEWIYPAKTRVGAFSLDGTSAIALGFEREVNYAFIFSTASGKITKKIWLDASNDHPFWRFSPDGKVLGGYVGEWVEPWNPNDGPSPMAWTLSFWNARTGKLSNELYNVFLVFWPNRKQTQPIISFDESGKLQLYDLQEKKISPFPFPQPWEKREIRQFRFSQNGTTFVLLDETGDVWAEEFSAP